MTKKELARVVAEKFDITDVFSLRIIRTVFNCMLKAMVAGEKLEFRGFGRFKTKLRKARPGRNPRAGTVVQVPERKVIVWKMGKELRERLQKKV